MLVNTKLISLKTIIVLTLPVLIYMMYIAIKWGVADTYFQIEFEKIKRFISGETSLSQEDWEASKANLSFAQKYDSKNPYILEYLALSKVELAKLNLSDAEFIALKKKLAQSVANSNSLKYSTVITEHEETELFANKTAEINSLQEQSLRDYRKSIELRPTWPFAWIRLAIAKYTFGEIDEEYFQAIENAYFYGPSVRVVQRFIIFLGLNGWEEFPKHNRRFTLKVIKEALGHINVAHVKRVLNIVRLEGHLNTVCFLHRDKEVVKEYCARNKS